MDRHAPSERKQPPYVAYRSSNRRSLADPKPWCPGTQDWKKCQSWNCCPRWGRRRSVRYRLASYRPVNYRLVINHLRMHCYSSMERPASRRRTIGSEKRAILWLSPILLWRAGPSWCCQAHCWAKAWSPKVGCAARGQTIRTWPLETCQVEFHWRTDPAIVVDSTCLAKN